MTAQRMITSTVRLAFLICLGCLIANGQSGQQAAREQRAQQARLFHAYTSPETEYIKAALDNLAIQARNEPACQVHMIVYGPRGEGSGSGEHILAASADYLVNSRDFDRSRLVTTYAGRYKDLNEVRTELWIVPPGAEPPKTREYQTNIQKVKGKFAEYIEYGGLPGSCEGECSYNVNLAGFADVLTEQPESVGYIVVSHQSGAPIGLWRRVAKGTAADLERRGINSERVRSIFAGMSKVKADQYWETATVQLWILSRDAPAPAKEARPEGLPKKAVQVGTFFNFELKFPATEKWVFEGFADVLKANNKLAACIIYRPPLAPNFRDPEIPRSPDEPPDIDLSKLIENWKTRLLKDYQIESRRIFVITAAATEGGDGTIETWIVPPGAAMPDPYATEPGESPND